MKFIRFSYNQKLISFAGVVSSFNWKGPGEDNPTVTDTTSGKTEGPNHLADLDYKVCIRAVSGYCRIEWSPKEQKIGTNTGLMRAR